MDEQATRNEEELFEEEDWEEEYEEEEEEEETSAFSIGEVSEEEISARLAAQLQTDIQANEESVRRLQESLRRDAVITQVPPEEIPVVLPDASLRATPHSLEEVEARPVRATNPYTAAARPAMPATPARPAITAQRPRRNLTAGGGFTDFEKKVSEIQGTIIPPRTVTAPRTLTPEPAPEVVPEPAPAPEPSFIYLEFLEPDSLPELTFLSTLYSTEVAPGTSDPEPDRFKAWTEVQRREVDFNSLLRSVRGRNAANVRGAIASVLQGETYGGFNGEVNTLIRAIRARNQNWDLLMAAEGQSEFNSMLGVIGLRPVQQ